MPISDAFTKEIVKLVRSMPDEAILALVKHQLGVGSGGAAVSVAAPAAAAPARRRARRPAKKRPSKPAAKPAAPKAARPSAKRPAQATGPDRAALLASVERVVKSGSGLAASDVARAAGIPQSRATSVLKELKQAKRVFQGGDRRFARYAGDPRTAAQASEHARKTASGPILKKKPAKRR
jgi:hypothetical protein